MRYKGRISDWKDDRGFGFVTPAGGGERAFVHIESFRNRQRRPVGNETVTYDLRVDSKGRPKALNVAFTDGRASAGTMRRSGSSRSSTTSGRSTTSRRAGTSGRGRLAGSGRPASPGRFPTLLAIVCLLLVTVAAATGLLPPVVLGVYAAGSGLTYFMYAWDKTAARNRRWRTSEQTLHLLSLLGGWPGAAIAQRRLRHKSRKRSFRIVFWITVVSNCAALVLILTGTAPDVNVDWG